MLTRLLGLLVLLKAVDVALRGPVGLPAAAWAAALGLWAGSGLALAAGRSAWPGVLVAGLLLAADAPVELRRQHLVLLLGVALCAVVARDRTERLLLWRVLLSTLYGVAALAKLNESFLGGDVLAGVLLGGPLGVLPPTWLLLAAGAALVLVEAALAVAVWVPRLGTAVLVTAAGLHAAALVAATDPLVGLRLVLFGGTAVVLCAAVREQPVRPSATPVPAGR